MKVQQISKEEFSQKVSKLDKVNLVETGFITKEDFNEMLHEFGIVNVTYEASHNLKSELLLAAKNPMYLIKNLNRIVYEKYKALSKYYKDKGKAMENRYPLSDYFFKAALIKSMNPKRVFEIGTWIGWGISIIKASNPEAECITMNIDGGEDANNYTSMEKVGSFYKKKGLDIIQILSDSTKFDFSTLGEVDVCYIDGNHKYEYAYSDLDNCSKIVQKAIVLDDYIPSRDSPRGDVLTWGWNNEAVVKAVDDYLGKNDNVFTSAYWIKETPVCILIK